MMNNLDNTRHDPSQLPLPGTAAERERQATRHQQAERIQAANQAVDEYMRTSGTRNYQQAFLHIQDTRPELFAGIQVPTHGRAAANFNPFHDQLGRFTTSDGAADPHGLHQRAKRTRMVNHAWTSTCAPAVRATTSRRFCTWKAPGPTSSQECKNPPAGPTASTSVRRNATLERRLGKQRKREQGSTMAS